MGLSAGLDQLPTPRPASVPAYIDSNDVLALHVWNALPNLQVCWWVRILDLNGIIQTLEWKATPSSDRSENVYRRALIAGYLLSASVEPWSGAPRRGQTWAVIALERTPSSGNVLSETVARGYITTSDSLTWPGGPYESSLSGPGNLRSVTFSNPAAGADFLITVPDHAYWAVNSLLFTLVTSAVVAVRTVSLQVTDGTNILLDLPSYSDVHESSGHHWSKCHENVNRPDFSGSLVDPLPYPLCLYPGWTIGSLTTHIDVGDQFSTIWIGVDEWLLP